MWAIEIKALEKTGHLVRCVRPIPQLLPHEVLIKTYAAGVNRADIFQKNGLYPPPPGTSDILGLEISGIIEKIGTAVTNFKIGDRVCALLEGGGYAEYAAAPASQTLPLPSNFDFISGAALPEAFFTVYSNLFHHANMKKGESLLIHGGTSGIGIVTIQMAKEYGIICYTTAGSDKKCDFLQELGANYAVNYKTTDFVNTILDKTNNAGVNCVIDMVGGEYFSRNLKLLASGGKLICIAFLTGAKVNVNIAPILFKNLTIMGTTLRSKTLAQKAHIASDLKKHIWPLLENGKIKPIIDSVFTVDDVENAHKLMESSQHIGKIILKS